MQNSIYVLLTGEKEDNPTRSSLCARLYHKNPHPILISGGFNGLAQTNLGIPECDSMKQNLIHHDVPEHLIYTDPRSYDTLGNFTFPLIDPLIQNPKISDFQKIIILTEKNHMPRAYSLASRVISPSKLEVATCEGDYDPSRSVEIYHRLLLKAIDSIQPQTPENIHQFLLDFHPHHREGWFNKPKVQRIIEYPIHILRWALYTNRK
jgi:uncharacterized SAM-binding protein YcdF (DUF218 family)